MNPREGVGLLDELEMLADVIESTAVLAELWAGRTELDKSDGERLRRTLVSVLTLTQSRLRLARGVVLQQVSPELVKTPRNTRGAIGAHEDPDIILLPPSVRPPRRGRR